MNTILSSWKATLLLAVAIFSFGTVAAAYLNATGPIRLQRENQQFILFLLKNGNNVQIPVPPPPSRM